MNYFQLGSVIIAVAYVTWVEFRMMNLAREVRIMKSRVEDEEITEKIHVMPDADLDSSLSKHIS